MIKRASKRPFQLLELMVAIFILLVCIAPVMRVFVSMYQSSQEITRENQRDHLSHMVHALFVEQLYKRQVPLGSLKTAEKITLNDPKLEELLKKAEYRFEGTFTLVDSHTTRGQEKPRQYLGELIIKMIDVKPNPKKHQDNQNKQEGIYDYFMTIDIGKTNNDAEQKGQEPKAKEEEKKKIS